MQNYGNEINMGMLQLCNKMKLVIYSDSKLTLIILEYKTFSRFQKMFKSKMILKLR